MADFVVKSLKAGMNNTDDPVSLPDNQSVLAMNVEYVRSSCGERRRGLAALDLTDSGLDGHDRVSFLHRHLPTSDYAEAELWALGVTGTSSSTLARKADIWTEVTPEDAIDLDYQYDLRALTIHGKLFFAYKSAVDRLHVWDGTTLRRTGLAEPAAPSAADTVGGGSFTGVRYYRQRYIERDGTTVLRRSEPSEVEVFTPTGSNSGAVITKAAAINEGETHWELEASEDNANFYRIFTTVVGTTTVTDTQSYSSGYAAIGNLSEDIGDYSLQPSAKILVADQDRIVAMGHYTDPALASYVWWGPVLGDPGAGNDERFPLDTNNFLNLDGYEGGSITGGSSAINGYIYVFKQSHIYKLVRTGERERAYEAVTVTKERGALPGSVTEGVDELGRPCVYFADPTVGPCLIGVNGLHQCGADMMKTWETINLDASAVIVRGNYYPATRQVFFRIATGANFVPNLCMVLQTNEMQMTRSGYRYGWTLADGGFAYAYAVCLHSTNIDTIAEPRSHALKPIIASALGTPLLRYTDAVDSDDDADALFSAHIRTKPYTIGSILRRQGVMAGALLAKTSLSQVDVSLIRDFVETTTPISVFLGNDIEGQPYVVKPIDDLKVRDGAFVQIDIVDTPLVETVRWELSQIALKMTGERTS